MTPTKTTVLLAATLATALAGGCRDEKTSLAPVAGPATTGGEALLTRRSSGVVLTVDGDEWTGHPAVKRAVTPVRVAIRNERQGDLLVRYDAFRLSDDDGESFAALPPYEIDEDQRIYVTGYEAAPMTTPAFGYDGYEVAPYYGGLYSGTGIGVYDGYDAWDVGYYRDYGSYWAELDMPTTEMVSRALPEGVIRSGGFVDGMLYFEHVDEDEDRVTMHVDLRDPETRVVVAQFAIPLEVESGD